MESAAAAAAAEYDEATILRLVTALYRGLIKIGGIEESDVLWAPDEGHQLDFSSLGDEARIDMRVVSLMQKLPIMKHQQNQILPLMYAVDYRYADHLALSRDIDKAEYFQPPYRLNMANALPSVLVLFRAEGRDDCTLLLDVAENTVREMDGALDLPETYLDLPTEHAPTYLQNMLDKYEAGYLIGGMGGGLECIGPEAKPFRLLHRVLVEEYGWPNAFRRDEWKRDAPNLIDEAQEAEMAHGRMVAAELRRRAAEGNGTVTITKEDAWMDL